MEQFNTDVVWLSDKVMLSGKIVYLKKQVSPGTNPILVKVAECLNEEAALAAGKLMTL